MSGIYEVNTLYAGEELPQKVRVSFELAYPCWCRLEKSRIWHQLLEVLGDVQTDLIDKR